MILADLLPFFNLDPITLTSIVVIIIASVFMSLMFSFSTSSFDCSLKSLDDTTQWDSPLSEFHCKRDSIEHEYMERIDRKSSITYSYSN